MPDCRIIQDLDPRSQCAEERGSFQSKEARDPHISEFLLPLRRLHSSMREVVRRSGRDESSSRTMAALVGVGVVKGEGEVGPDLIGLKERAGLGTMNSGRGGERR
ncbi:hypothetical protein CRG98_018104 [Punica granatum]|uniref:Uncharacterized protein n=1 Tax=Punica granatum TaxID=22663 RepID=A0A2I0K087_PUNGR|nr:hypothetical protein CRG98_018104 [Punica granatum]